MVEDAHVHTDTNTQISLSPKKGGNPAFFDNMKET